MPLLRRHLAPILPFRIQRHLISSAQAVPLSFVAHGDPEKHRQHSPLVICHGLFGQKTNWNSVGKALQRRLGNVVYTVDLRNHGESPWVDDMTYAAMAADVAKFMQEKGAETGWKRLNLLGHSMGGKSAMRLAVDPEGASLIDRLIIEDVSPAGYTPNNLKFRAYIDSLKSLDMNLPRRELLDNLATSIPDLAIRQFLLTNLQSTPSGPFKWKCNIKAIENHVDDVLGFTIPHGSFRGPTLFLHGAISGYVPEADKPLIRSLFPRVVFSAVPKAGHWVHVEQPEVFIETVYQFLAS